MTDIWYWKKERLIGGNNNNRERERERECESNNNNNKKKKKKVKRHFCCEEHDWNVNN
jgi:hypothetical protein